MNIYIQRLQAISLPNKYTTWYLNIVQKALNRDSISGYYEKHHILPKSFKMGGESDPINIVKLSAKEHYLCHRLLPLMIEHKSLKLKMACALLYMSYGNGQTPKHLPPSSTIENIKNKLSVLKRGIKGKKWTEQQKLKLKNRSSHNKGVPMTEEAKENLRIKRANQFIGPRTETTKKKITKTLKGKTKGRIWWNNGVQTVRSITCPGEGWVKGSLQRTVKGLKWWTDGQSETRALDCPGDNWYPGRKSPQIK